MKRLMIALALFAAPLCAQTSQPPCPNVMKPPVHVGFLADIAALRGETRDRLGVDANAACDSLTAVYLLTITNRPKLAGAELAAYDRSVRAYPALLRLADKIGVQVQTIAEKARLACAPKDAWECVVYAPDCHSR